MKKFVLIAVCLLGCYFALKTCPNREKHIYCVIEKYQKCQTKKSLIEDITNSFIASDINNKLECDNYYLFSVGKYKTQKQEVISIGMFDNVLVLNPTERKGKK